MATLKDLQTGRLYPLRAEHTVGRSRRSDLRVARREVSGLHATIRWAGTAWEIVDHGSRNGTRCGPDPTAPGEPLTAGEPRRLAVGDAIAFGSGAAGWVFASASPPAAIAVALDGAAAVSEGGLLALPNADAPEVTVYLAADGRWVAESDRGIEAIEDGDLIEVAGARWRLELPDPFERTLEEKQTEPDLATLSFRFEVSRDEEFVSLAAIHRGAPIDLGSRAHNYTLLTLARIRLDERAGGAEEPACGWAHVEDLSKMLRITEQRLNLDVYRARRQLGKAGIRSAAGVVERRAYHKTLRFGAPGIEILTI